MRVCRYQEDDRDWFGLLIDDETLLPLADLAHALGAYDLQVSSILDLLPGGALREDLLRLQQGINAEILSEHARPVEEVRLLIPVAAPGKLILLAGNYPQHVAERGGKAEERARTFPYLFMKPTTTLTHPDDPIRIPAISPAEIDWEIELGVIIGRECRQVSEATALNYVAGYTVVNDISDRAFHPNPDRAPRPKDPFFDWQHGKWHDTFCPLGPCVLPAASDVDPQNLRMTLSVNGEVQQDGTTADMIFPVAAVIEFVSSFVTLLPGDIISTGTPSGVGKAKGKFLRAGDIVTAKIEKIGVLRNPVV